MDTMWYRVLEMTIICMNLNEFVWFKQTVYDENTFFIKMYCPLSISNCLLLQFSTLFPLCSFPFNFIFEFLNLLNFLIFFSYMFATSVKFIATAQAWESASLLCLGFIFLCLFLGRFVFDQYLVLYLFCGLL